MKQPERSIRSQVKSTDPFPVDFDEVWPWVGYSSKGVAKNELERCSFEENIDYSIFVNITKIPSKKKSTKKGRAEQKYLLTVDCMKEFCMMSRTEKGREVRRWYIQLEKEYRKLLEESRTPKPPRTLELLIAREEGIVVRKEATAIVKEHCTWSTCTIYIQKGTSQPSRNAGTGTPISF